MLNSEKSHLNDYLKTEFFDCDCASPNHAISFTWFDDEEQACYIEFPVEPKRYWRRLKDCFYLLFCKKQVDWLGDWICRQGEEEKFLRYLQFMRDNVRGELSSSDKVCLKTDNGEYILELKYDKEFDWIYFDIIYGTHNSIFKKLKWCFGNLTGSWRIFSHKCFEIKRSDFDNAVQFILRNKTEERMLKHLNKGDIYQPKLFKE